ncbi:IS110 family transposase [uncultured Imperialibacter sp.]|uniref:IS110 family transposase n=1 Tax=uncultured Imperialibacter sp. TaxID=1672639 RepID=UPI0030D99FF4|tara:strand:+ start:2071 stop:3471 length:1401 start_codon:yes stop_codon:yes gene_type:complete
MKKMPLTVVNPHAAGIDVGSRTHFVAIGQEQKDVKSFGVYAEDLSSLVKWLIDSQVTTVAMESTGAYWQNLFVELINSGIEVVLTNGKFTKNINRKKTDVLDCQWIQKMHSLGLLPSSFLPDHTTERLRTLCRHRTNMIQQRADSIHKMAKFLKYLNFRLDVVVRDIAGQTGLKIIEEICNGNLDPKALAAHRHHNCRRSEEEIAKALVSNKREDYLFGLKQEFARHQFYTSMVIDCDKEISQFLEQTIQQKEDVVDDIPDGKYFKRQNKNAITGIDLNIASYQYFNGVDLLAIPGVSHSTILSLMSEIGPDGFNQFPTAQHFASWLKLAPNNKISGGRVLSNRIPQGSNRLKIALRNAANAVGNLKDSDLTKFFKKIAFKKGRQTAINATARKIAVILWNMITKRQPYKPKNNYLFLDQKRRIVSRMRKQIADLGINPDDLGFSRANRDKIAAQMPSDYQPFSLR